LKKNYITADRWKHFLQVSIQIFFCRSTT